MRLILGHYGRQRGLLELGTIPRMIEDTAPPTGLFTDDHQVTRCVWCRATPEYQHYHDHEWGFPVQDDRRLFEKVCLEGFQAGLSWLTILKKREAFRRGFAEFDIDQVAGFGESDTKRLLLDAGIVRHHGKIASTINNAQRAQEIRKEFGSLAAYFWRFEPATDTRPPQITRQTMSGITTSAESIALSKDLRKRGWSFVGQPPCTPSCRQWDWSTTTFKDVRRVEGHCRHAMTSSVPKTH